MNSKIQFAVIVFLCSIEMHVISGCKQAAIVAPPEPVVVVPVQQASPPVVDQSMKAEAFAQAVASADLLEISLGKLAIQNGDAQTVKDFGQRMAANHTAIQVLITNIAAAQGFILPTSLDANDEAIVARFSALHGVEFDKAYMTVMAEKHPKTLSMFRWQYDNCTDVVLKPFAVQTMPIIATHARVAEQLNAEVNKEEIRIAAEFKAAELKAAELRKAEAVAAAAAAAQLQASKKSKSKKAPPASP